jgi:hypothetical protein
MDLILNGHRLSFASGRLVRRPAVELLLAVAKVAKTFGIIPLSSHRPKLLASFATRQFSIAARLTKDENARGERLNRDKHVIFRGGH